MYPTIALRWLPLTGICTAWIGASRRVSKNTQESCMGVWTSCYSSFISKKPVHLKINLIQPKQTSAYIHSHWYTHSWSLVIIYITRRLLLLKKIISVLFISVLFLLDNNKIKWRTITFDIASCFSNLSFISKQWEIFLRRLTKIIQICRYLNSLKDTSC